MDTKWTKFKESNFIKAVSVVLGCVMIALACNSAISVIAYCYNFGSVENNQTVVDSNRFNYNINSDISFIRQSVLYNKRSAEIESERERGAKQFLEEYKEYKENFDRNVEAEKKINDVNDSDDEYEYNTEITTFVSQYSDPYFSTSIEVNVLDTTNFIIPAVIDCHKNMTDDEIKNLFFDEFDSKISEKGYYSPEELAGQNLKNVLYYAEADDGTVVTNAASKEAVIEKATGENKYLFFENNEMTSNLDREACPPLKSEKIRGTNIYIAVDTTFSQEDNYKELKDKLSEVSQIDIEKSIVKTVLFIALTLLFFVITICLAGNKNGKKCLAPIDKVPYDIHLIASGALVLLCVLGFCVFVTYFLDFNYTNYGVSYDVPDFLFSSPWLQIISCTFAVLAYLFTAEFFTSFARGIKAGTNIFKHTLFYKLCRFAFRVIKKFLYKVKDFIKAIVYKPKHFDRKTVITITSFALFNIFSTLFASYLIAVVYEDISIVIGIIFAFAVLLLDGYIIYNAVKYLRSLDKIITAVENSEPVSENTDTLPNSIKVLAESYDIANANLQSAIVKAVKDERTKAELITNVSHDLKTPLTSVINYIDLLQKCDIDDETAKEYMTVIAEKSGKLKRLIEDLIEASKISSGNVTINKSKLNLNELAAQAIVEETAEFEKRNLQMVFEEPAQKHIAFADGTKIYRVLENLLSNAKKYSAPDSRVYVKLYSMNDCECFEIKNISKEPLNISAQELTERFVRGDKSRSEDGNGLGLSIATELCRLNGGELIISIDGDLFKATVKIPK